MLWLHLAAVAALHAAPIERRTLLVSGGAASVARTDAAAVRVLNDGTAFPAASFGLQVYDDDRAFRYTTAALECGYRNFFASVLAGNQRGFGRAVRASGVPRSEIFVCGSVLSNRASGFDAALRATRRGCDANLADLDVGPLDMIMLDYPGPDADSIRGQWQGLEDMKRRGEVRSLAVSNFSPGQLDVLPAPPTVNQLPFGVGYKPDLNRRLLAENARRNVLVQAWSPLRVVSSSAKAACAAIGTKYGKTPQQVALRWILQKDATFTTQSTNPDHIRQSIDLFDFMLDEDDMARLADA